MRNNMISFWRIVFTYSIAIFHLFNGYGCYRGLGATGVEFFFIVSGWLLAQYAEKVKKLRMNISGIDLEDYIRNI